MEKAITFLVSTYLELLIKQTCASCYLYLYGITMNRTEKIHTQLRKRQLPESITPLSSRAPCGFVFPYPNISIKERAPHTWAIARKIFSMSCEV